MTRTPVCLLFVEDSALDVELARHLLEQDGFDVACAQVDTEAALRELLSEFLPDVVLSDFRMPGFDGASALRIVRELAPDVPFIFVSGAIGEERAIEALHHGAADYVLKDNLQRLGSSVRRALEHARERQRRLALEDERTRLAEIIDATADLVAIIDPDRTLRYLNAAGARLIGGAREELLGQRMDRYCPEWAGHQLRRVAMPAAAQSGTWQGEAAVLSAAGVEVPTVQQVLAHRDAHGEVRYYSVIAHDIRERKAYEARLEHFANYDRLTDIPNRRLLEDRGTQAVAHARRSGRPCAVFTIEVDRLDLIKQTYDYRASDELLRLVAERLQRCVRDGDTLARFGDDAFAVLATDLAREGDALVLATKIHKCMHAPFRIAASDIRVTTSIGMSTFPRDADTFDLLLRNADIAAQRARQQGGNRHQFYLPEMNESAQKALRLQAELMRAVDACEFALYYQPKVDIASGRIAGLEALLRWNHPERGVVGPGEFIPALEDTGHIVEVGEWVMMAVCHQIVSWQAQGITAPPVAINLSARQFHQNDLAASVKTTLDLTGVDPGLLEFELTESMLMGDVAEAARIMHDLKACGVRLAIDDFGVGYSSLAYLTRFPLDCLKIDRTFITKVPASREDTIIAEAIIRLARALRVTVVAEGVETDAQLSFLTLHGCNQFQGYYFSPPLPEPRITEMLRQAL